MADNKSYTVQELNALRRVVENKWLFGSYNFVQTPGYSGLSRSYREDEKHKCVEEMVRTHMLAGHTAEQLLASECTGEKA